MNERLILPATAEVKESYRKFAERITCRQVKDSAIKKIRVRTFSRRIRREVDFDIEVGAELDWNLSNTPHEKVLAIFESGGYIVVTPDKSNLRGTVYFFEPNEVYGIEQFS